MKSSKNLCEFRILIKNKPITEYVKDANTFIEGRRNSEFSIEFKNNQTSRVLAVFSVDGLCTIDGKPATSDSPGLIVEPLQTVVIPGWTLNADAVSKFVFQDREKSYAVDRAKKTKSVAQVGAVGVMVFSEKKPIIKQTIVRDRWIYPYPYNTPNYPNPIQPWQNPAWPYYPHTPYYNTWTCSSAAGGAQTTTVYNGLPPQNSISGNTSENAPVNMSSCNPAMDSVNMAVNNVQVAGETPFEVGTGWGEKTEFKTTTVAFERESVIEKMVIYYDSRRNLEKRGIEVSKRERAHLTDLPQAFAVVGCTPPDGWCA